MDIGEWGLVGLVLGMYCMPIASGGKCSHFVWLLECSIMAFPTIVCSELDLMLLHEGRAFFHVSFPSSFRFSFLSCGTGSISSIMFFLWRKWILEGVSFWKRALRVEIYA